MYLVLKDTLRSLSVVSMPSTLYIHKVDLI